MRTLIKNGTVVTASDTYTGDVLVEDQHISAIGVDLDVEADRVIDADAALRDPRRHRCAHASGHAIWRQRVGRRLRNRHDRRSLRRHHLTGRLRHPVQGRTPA